MRFERNILFRTLASGLVAVLVAVLLIWTRGMSRQAEVMLTLLVVLPWIIMGFWVRSKVVYPLRTLSNLMEALREGDYSMRLRGADRSDALGRVDSGSQSFNSLPAGQTL